MTEAALGFGVTLSRRTGPTTFALLGELVDLSPPTQTREAKDATHHASPGKVREYIGGLRDGGEAAFVLHYPRDGMAASDLKADYDSDDPVDYKIVWPAPVDDEVIFPGLITELGAATPLDDKMTLSGKIKVAGQPSWAED